MSEPVRGPTRRTAVRTSTDLATWTHQPHMQFTGGSEGQGEVLGNAQFHLDWGNVFLDGAAPGIIAEPSDLEGRFVEVLKEDPAGTVTIDTVAYIPFWHGIMLAPTSVPAASGGANSYTAQGIGCLLNEINCQWGRTLKGDGSTVTVLHRIADCNALPAGDRSTSTATVGGHTVYVHDLRNESGGNAWTALQWLEYVMACNFRWEDALTATGSGQVGIDWEIVDPTSCLAYQVPRYQPYGKTLQQVWTDLAGKMRGLTFSCSIVYDGVTPIFTVTVWSGSAAAIGSTVPANPEVWNQLDNTSPYLHPITIRTVADQVADEIAIRAGQRHIGISLGIWGSGSPWTADADAQMGKGWSDAAEALKDANLGLPPRATYAHAWQRFVLKPSWNLRQFESTVEGLPNSFDVDGTGTNPVFGYHGREGTAEHIASPSYEYPALALEAMDDLPAALGFTALAVGVRQPVVIIYEASTGVFVDVSSEWGLSIESSPPAVLLDDGAYGATIRETLTDGRKIIVSMGLIDALPFMVSWRRAPGEWPRVVPRVKTISRPDLTHEYLLNEMVQTVSSDDGGTLTKLSARVTTRDNLPQLIDLLNQARAFYESPYKIATFTDRGVLNIDPAYQPGTILGDITDGTAAQTIGATVTRRSWKLQYATGVDSVSVPYWETTWETDVIYPDLGVL